MTSIWAVWRRVNPHRWNNGDKSLIVAYDNEDDAKNFVAIHPQYHYRPGQDTPVFVLEIDRLEIGVVSPYWNPSFP